MGEQFNLPSTFRPLAGASSRGTEVEKVSRWVKGEREDSLILLPHFDSLLIHLIRLHLMEPKPGAMEISFLKRQNHKVEKMRVNLQLHFKTWAITQLARFQKNVHSFGCCFPISLVPVS